MGEAPDYVKNDCTFSRLSANYCINIQKYTDKIVIKSFLVKWIGVAAPNIIWLYCNLANVHSKMEQNCTIKNGNNNE